MKNTFKCLKFYFFCWRIVKKLLDTFCRHSGVCFSKKSHKKFILIHFEDLQQQKSVASLIEA